MSQSTRTAGQWWTAKGESTTVSLAKTRDLAIALLQQAGANDEDAAFIADIHLAKALQGDHERGMTMLVDQIRAARSGELRLTATVRVLRDHGATALVAADEGDSPKLVCRAAMHLAIRKAQEFGVGCVSAQAKAELLTPFIEQAVAAGMVTMILAQGIPLVAPYGGVTPLLGNAPVGWGIPAGRNPAVIADMSLTQTSAKGVVNAARQGEPVPPGFILDPEGHPTTDPSQFVDPQWLQQGKTVARGSLVPIGDSHKSYALVFVAGLLTSMLAGGDFAWQLGNDAPAPGKFSSVFIVIDPAAFGDRDAMLARVDEYIEHLRGSQRREGVPQILYPGERSQALKRSRAKADALELPVEQYAALVALRGGFR